ncbi:unnamed protein product [Cyclocybe aegerita]|uniref:HTH CENPB-type domain-containing protein n=1 Tax=Cyclocybe aegerita TaxID=1973307 RepID=A0A8S0W133_CYCAE|nr:unnamed protein product [Cyclocybe aegerita]
MVGRPKSLAQRQQEAKRAHEALMSRAVEAYRAELEKPDHRARRGLRTICKDFEQLYFEETGDRIRLSHMTLSRLADGGLTRVQANATRSWLSKGEEDVVVEFILDMAARGWPLSHRRLKEHVDMICHARKRKNFPVEGVGQNWTTRFVQRHSDRLKMKDSRPLEDKRGRGANPTANKQYWALLNETIKKYNIRPETTFGTDEIGIQNRGEESERVIAPAHGKGPQYQQRGGTRENTTVLVTICADGTAIPPTVIFKGEALQVGWGDNNPLNATLGYQKKGWTDGEIGAEWIKIFDKATKDKVKQGEYRLLLVDGHNSHYTVAFLLYAREHLILVICYPSHTTHIYQGLDVVIFAVLKRCIGEERDGWLRKYGIAMDKKNFLEIYSRAHVRALTEDNVKAAFRKTGVWPFNPDVVTPDMLAPSKETSSEATLPLVSTDPAINVLATMFRKLAVSSDVESGTISEVPPSGSGTKHAAINEAVAGLSQTKLAHLISTTLITSDDAMPTTIPHTIPTHVPAPPPLLSIQPQTETEVLLLAALRESHDTNSKLASRNIELQANNLLNEVYCGKAKSQLQHQEEKKKGGCTGKETLKADGLGRLLTGDEFYEARQEHEKRKRLEARDKAERKDARAAYQAAKAKWDKEEEGRKALKEQEAEKHKKAVAAWEKAKTRANAVRTGRASTFKSPKPKMGFVPKRVPPPKLKDFLGGSAAESSEEDEDTDEAE